MLAHLSESLCPPSTWRSICAFNVHQNHLCILGAIINRVIYGHDLDCRRKLYFALYVNSDFFFFFLQMTTLRAMLRRILRDP